MNVPNKPRQPSQARIEANRRNAQKSTGPRTPAGKAASSRNRLLHGLRANKHILLDEDPAEFLILLHDHLDRFQPVGPAEEDLVLRIAADQWRLRRIFPMEAGIYRGRFQSVAARDKALRSQHTADMEQAEESGDPPPPPPVAPGKGDLLARAFSVDCQGSNSLMKLSRY
ncbi:MAG TPA: hypothetical protein VLY04_16735, partial [Bryobacteraceae bacterium]|nr:hypothetical protein [Bryobacteraceae bacterium]